MRWSPSSNRKGLMKAMWRRHRVERTAARVRILRTALLFSFFAVAWTVGGRYSASQEQIPLNAYFASPNIPIIIWPRLTAVPDPGSLDRIFDSTDLQVLSNSLDAEGFHPKINGRPVIVLEVRFPLQIGKDRRFQSRFSCHTARIFQTPYRLEIKNLRRSSIMNSVCPSLTLDKKK